MSRIGVKIGRMRAVSTFGILVFGIVGLIHFLILRAHQCAFFSTSDLIAHCLGSAFATLAISGVIPAIWITCRADGTRNAAGPLTLWGVLAIACFALAMTGASWDVAHGGNPCEVY